MRLMDRRRALMGNAAKSITNPECIFAPNRLYNRFGGETDWLGSGLTAYLPVARGDTFVYLNPVPPPNVQTTGEGLLGTIQVTDAAYVRRDYWNCRANGTERTFACATITPTGYVRLNIIMDGLADSYAYNATTGVVYYAGSNTPYYGKTNIND